MRRRLWLVPALGDWNARCNWRGAGYQVALADDAEEPGGRVLRESRLAGLSAWSRVADYRLYQLRQFGNVQIYARSSIGARDVLDMAAEHVFLATGSRWRADGLGRSTQRTPPRLAPDARVLTPDDIMNGTQPPKGPVAIYDDDQIYMAGFWPNIWPGRNTR